jgi:hypothetical protein
VSDYLIRCALVKKYGWVNYSPVRWSGESQVAHPSSTPVSVDCILSLVEPLASNLPRRNLFSTAEGDYDVGPVGYCAIPRHGPCPSPVPANWPTNQPLPGAINVSFFDDHS